MTKGVIPSWKQKERQVFQGRVEDRCKPTSGFNMKRAREKYLMKNLIVDIKTIEFTEECLN